MDSSSSMTSSSGGSSAAAASCQKDLNTICMGFCDAEMTGVSLKTQSHMFMNLQTFTVKLVFLIQTELLLSPFLSLYVTFVFCLFAVLLKEHRLLFFSLQSTKHWSYFSLFFVHSENSERPLWLSDTSLQILSHPLQSPDDRLLRLTSGL